MPSARNLVASDTRGKSCSRPAQARESIIIQYERQSYYSKVNALKSKARLSQLNRHRIVENLFNQNLKNLKNLKTDFFNIEFILIIIRSYQDSVSKTSN